MTTATALTWEELAALLDLPMTTDPDEQTRECRARRAEMLAHIGEIQAGEHRSLSEKLRAVAMCREEIVVVEEWLDAAGEPYEVD